MQSSGNLNKQYTLGDLRDKFRSGLPHVSSLYDGLTPEQIKGLEDAVTTGFAQSGNKLGAVGSLAKIQDALRKYQNRKHIQ